MRGQPALQGGSNRETELDGVVRELQRIDRAAGIGKKLAIGEVILHRFFSGSVTTWRMRGAKCQSLRRIASRDDCPFGKTTLHEAVAIYVVTLAIPELQTFGHVSSSHIAAVLPLPATEQAQMLRKAESERWSVRRLKLEVQRHRGDGAGRRGVSRTSLSGSIRLVEQRLDALLATTQWDEDTVHALRAARGAIASALQKIDLALAMFSVV